MDPRCMIASLLLLLLLLVGEVPAAQIPCPSPPVKYAGNAAGFILYDNWLAKTATSQPTSMCQNHERFFAANDDAFVAISYGPFEDGVGCGGCIQVTSGGGRTETLTVIEGINTLSPGDIQLPQRTLDRLVGTGPAGSTDISWSYVPCPALAGQHLLYWFSAGATTTNMAQIAISNASVGIREVYIKDPTKGYSSLQRSGRSVYWNLPQGAIQTPFTVQVVSTSYETVEFVVPTINGDQKFLDSGVSLIGTCFEAPATNAPVPVAAKDKTKSNHGARNRSAPYWIWAVIGLCAVCLF